LSIVFRLLVGFVFNTTINLIVYKHFTTMKCYINCSFTRTGN